MPAVSPYAAQRTTTQWLNPAAFPFQNLAVNYGTPNQIGIGRFGNAPVGGVVGPGTANFSLSLMKSVSFHEQTRFQFSVEAANVFNHRNYEPPNMQVDSAASAPSPPCKPPKAPAPAASNSPPASPSNRQLHLKLTT